VKFDFLEVGIRPESPEIGLPHLSEFINFARQVFSTQWLYRCRNTCYFSPSKRI